MSGTIGTRPIVLKLYKTILRFSKSWENGKNTLPERLYIKKEAATLFRKNAGLTDVKVIQDCINEGQARMELATHYKTPYPRPVNVPPRSLARSTVGKNKGKEQGQTQERNKKQSIPVYIKSHFER